MRIAIFEAHLMPRYFRARPLRHVQIPILKSFDCCARLLRPHRQWHAADPDVFLVHAANQPHRVLVTRAIVAPFGEPANVLRADAVEDAGITLNGKLALHDAHVAEVDAVVTGDDDERETI